MVGGQRPALASTIAGLLFIHLSFAVVDPIRPNACFFAGSLLIPRSGLLEHDLRDVHELHKVTNFLEAVRDGNDRAGK